MENETCKQYEMLLSKLGIKTYTEDDTDEDQVLRLYAVVGSDEIELTHFTFEDLVTWINSAK